MRILYFTRDYTPHDHRFLSALAKTEHKVFALRLERRGVQREDRPLPPEIEQITWQGGREPARWQNGLRLLSGLRRIIREVKPDLIHAGTIQTSAFLTALAGFKPLVSMSWGSDLLVDTDRNFLWRWATRFTLQRSRILLGDCQAVADKAAALGFPRKNVVIFPWGVDLAHFTPEGPSDLRERRGWNDCFVLLSLRSWEPLYGVHELVRAFAIAAAKAPQLRLIWIGSGSQAAEIRKIILENGLMDRVFFGGQVNNLDLPKIYRSADLYVSASHSDGSSVSLMEALACGVPSLVSDIPGNLEWITPGEQGWLFPTGQPQAMAQAMLAAVFQQDRLKDMGRKAHLLAEQRANWQKNVQSLLEAYETAVSS